MRYWRGVISLTLTLFLITAMGIHFAWGAAGIVDNIDPKFSVVGIWGTYVGAGGTYGVDFRYNAAGVGIDKATWLAELSDSAGSYEVFIWYPSFPVLATNAPFTITYADPVTGLPASNTILIDQTQDGGQWVSLGIYDFIDDCCEGVNLTDKADSLVVADAVRFEPVGVVDNTDTDFKVTGTWGTYSGASATYSTSFRYNSAGTGADTATWPALLTEGAGSYEVKIWYPSFSVLATNAPFTVNYTDPVTGLPASNTVLIDQTQDGGQWVSLGIYDFADKGPENVILSDNANSWVVADAIRFKAPDGIVDNNDPNFSVLGSWDTFTGRDSVYGTDFRYSDAGTGIDSATWLVELTEGPGLYEVKVWYLSDPVFATDAPFTVNYTDPATGLPTSNTVLVDQTQNGSQWVSLGIYNFADNGTEDVILSDKANSNVVADAVRFVK
ncbi:MAG: hypothetical protein HY999_05360 [Nitrospinae bacterium]|nr:hypothetical protein [Nitrospinota bacterium]